MSNQEPDYTWARMVGHEIQKVVDFCWEQYQKTGSASIELISPQELSRLRLIADWAKFAVKNMELDIKMAQACDGDVYLHKKLVRDYDKITAPKEEGCDTL